MTRLIARPPPRVIVIGTIGAAISGIIGGALAALVAPSRPFAHAAAVLIFIAIDATYVLTHFPGPWWIDAIGSATLAVTTLAGGAVGASRRKTLAEA